MSIDTLEPVVGLDDPVHGVELVDLVIERVKSHGFDVLGRCGLPHQAVPIPVPAHRLETLRFPSGAPLSPALRRWLAFDGRWLQWFDDPAEPVFNPMKIGAYARTEYGIDWGYGALEKTVLPGDVFGLHFGADSRRLLYVGEPDSHGEYPVLLTDDDDTPYIGVEYPGIDVYLAENAGILRLNISTYGGLINDGRYGPRMRQHAERYFEGERGIFLGSDLWPWESMMEAGEDHESGINPMTGLPIIGSEPVTSNPARKKVVRKAAAKRATKKVEKSAKKKVAKKPAKKKPSKRKVTKKKVTKKPARKR